jgi:hypothetical protein
MVVMLPPSSHGDYNLQLTGGTVRVSWVINASQNLTSYTHALVFPANLSSTLMGAELEAFTSALQAAVQQKVNAATVSDVTVQVSSNSASLTCSDNCAPQWLNATAQFDVHEPPQTSVGATRYDLSWKPLRIDQNLLTKDVEFNRIGKYLTPALQPFFNIQASRSLSITVNVNGRPAQKTTYQTVTDLIVLFDVSNLRAPLDQWSRTLDVSSQTQTWTSPQKGGFNATATERLTEAGETVRILYFFGATLHAQMTTPMNTGSGGDIVFIRSGSIWDQILLATIIAPLGVLVGTSIIEWRVTQRPRQPSRKGGKTTTVPQKQKSR